MKWARTGGLTRAEALRLVLDETDSKPRFRAVIAEALEIYYAKSSGAVA